LEFLASQIALSGNSLETWANTGEVNMRTFMVALFVFFAGVSCAFSKTYPTCEKLKLHGGEIVYLSTKAGDICWRLLAQKQISRNDLKIKGGTYRFSYIFGDDELDDNFDPIFNVKIKELAVENSVLNTKIGLYRAEIRTNCKKHILKKIAAGTYDKFTETDVSGSLFNDYHAGKRNDPGSALSDFHIGFENSLKKCVRTDDKKLRRTFEIDGIRFPPEQGKIAGTFAALIGTAPAIAEGRDAARYKKISVQIGKGEFRGGDYLVGSFFVPAGADFDVIASDLSTHLAGDFLRPSVKFEIRDN
jgi:hypothetical protein